MISALGFLTLLSMSLDVVVSAMRRMKIISNRLHMIPPALRATQEPNGAKITSLVAPVVLVIKVKTQDTSQPIHMSFRITTENRGTKETESKVLCSI